MWCRVCGSRLHIVITNNRTHRHSHDHADINTTNHDNRKWNLPPQPEALE